MSNLYPNLQPHGGPDALGVPLHDFSTNSNACGPCPLVAQALARVDASHYPDPHYTALRQQLGGFHGVAPHRVVLAGSASEFIFRVTSLVARQGARTVSVPPNAYGDYAQAAQAHGLAVVLSGEPAALHWACEPSSPLGQPHGLTGWATAAGLRVLDSAYAPLRLSGSSLVTAEALRGVWQLHTPNKALGLTGIRAAYAIAPADAGEDVQALAQLCPSWPVGAHGVALLQAWTLPSTQTWLAQSLITLSDWKTRQVKLCESLGWTCLSSDVNFFCARPALPEGMTLAQALDGLRGQGIKLRDTASFDMPDHVRLGVLPPASQDALKTTWRQLLKAPA